MINASYLSAEKRDGGSSGIVLKGQMAHDTEAATWDGSVRWSGGCLWRLKTYHAAIFRISGRDLVCWHTGEDLPETSCSSLISEWQRTEQAPEWPLGEEMSRSSWSWKKVNGMTDTMRKKVQHKEYPSEAIQRANKVKNYRKKCQRDSNFISNQQSCKSQSNGVPFEA